MIKIRSEINNILTKEELFSNCEEEITWNFKYSNTDKKTQLWFKQFLKFWFTIYFEILQTNISFNSMILLYYDSLN